MGSNRFGNIFTISTWGESHGKAIGVVIDGVPSGVSFNEEILNFELEKRRPGRNHLTSPRKETDYGEIYSGIFDGKTTGAPVSIIIFNSSYDSTPYEKIKDVYRPGHANFTYLHKYGIYDYRGGGRASGRETACRVAAGALAKAILNEFKISVSSSLHSIGDISAQSPIDGYESPIFCKDPYAEKKMVALLEKVIEANDSIGGTIITEVQNLPIGIGEPIYLKTESVIANAILTIPAIKGIQFGNPDCAKMRGHNYVDPFILNNQKVSTFSNNSGGLLGGITNGEELYFTAECKPTSSIKQKIPSVTIDNEIVEYKVPTSGKHDPCIAIRAVPVIEAMTAISLADLLLMTRLNQI